MKSIKRLLFRDIKITFKSVLFKLGLFFIFYFLLNWAEIQGLKSYQLIDVKSIILENFKGCGYEINFSKGFIFPTKWLLINAYIIYVIGDYFYKDMKVNSKYLLIRNKKLIHIFTSKTLWAFIVILFYYGMLLLISVILGLVFYSPQDITTQFYHEMNTLTLIITVFTLYSLTSFTLCIVFYTLSLKLKPVYCFLLAMIACVSSIFFKNNFLLGQHNLLFRHVPFDVAHSLTTEYSVLYNLILSLTFLLIATFLCNKKEIF